MREEVMEGDKKNYKKKQKKNFGKVDACQVY